jgi:hypothetical protein
MSHYIVEEKLDSTTIDKVKSAVLSLLISAVLIGLLWFMHISMPNPPFEVKEGVLELDMGVVDGGFGNPNDGGPSQTPPALGDKGGSGGGNPVQSGGEGKVITNDADNSANLPPIDPPKTGDQLDPNLAKRLPTGKRTGSSQEGSTRGWKDGKGTDGQGKGENNDGVQGNSTRSNPGNRGKGLISARFTNFKLISDVEVVQAQGTGIIVFEVKVDCYGNFRILGGEATGTTYNAGDAKAVFMSVLSRSTFKKMGEDCPETGKVSVTIRPSL